MNIPGFEIIKKVGQGGMATVYKARQKSVDRLVAVKILKPELSRNLQDIEGFIHEARAAGNLKHPNIMQIHDVAEHNGVYYIVMEFVEGPTVVDLLEKRGVIPARKALSILQPVANALDTAWRELSMVHRDVKPENIMIDKDGTVKLADMGLASILGSQPDDPELVKGTPFYMSPEQISAVVNLDCRSDMYSLGATLYHMLTGVMPFQDDTPQVAMDKHVHDHLPNPRDVRATVPIGVAQFTLRLMMKDPAQRFSAWPAMLQELQKVTQGRMLLARQDTKKESTVLPYSKAATMSKRQLKRASRVGPRGLPALAHLVLWLAMLGWWGFLGHKLVYLPPRDDTDSSSAPPIVASPALPSPAASPRRPEPVATSAHGTAVRPSPTIGPPPTDPATSTPRVPPDNRGPKEVSMATTLYKSTVQSLLRNQPKRAISLIEGELKFEHAEWFKDDMTALLVFIRKLPRVEQKLLSAAREKIGEEIRFKRGKQDVRLTMRIISGSTIKGTLISDQAGIEKRTPVSFTVGQLPPTILSGWLGNPTTTEEYTMKVLLHMRAKDNASVRHYASKCGPLSNVFTQLLASP